MSKLLFLDTETTGNDLANDRLFQISFQIGDTIKTEYFKPPVPITVKSMSITHVTNEMVEGKPPFQASSMKEELEKLLTDHILVAHNARFDVAMLEAEGLKIDKYICTLKLSHYLDTAGIIPEYNLQFLRYYLDLKVEGSAHDAEGDVKVLRALFERQMAKLKESGRDEKELIDEMVKISQTPLLFKKFTFGKYKDKQVAEVAKLDKNYLEWLLKQKLENNEDDEDWIFTLKYYLGN